VRGSLGTLACHGVLRCVVGGAAGRDVGAQPGDLGVAAAVVEVDPLCAFVVPVQRAAAHDDIELLPGPGAQLQPRRCAAPLGFAAFLRERLLALSLGSAAVRVVDQLL
jgi:hypothetical protein